MEKIIKPRSPRTKKIKHKTKIAVTDSGNLQCQCLCGYKGTVFVQGKLTETMAAIDQEARLHCPKPKK